MNADPRGLRADAAKTAPDHHPSGTVRSPVFDVAVVGAGLAGTLAALGLARTGCRVALFDLQAEPQPEFRAEQLVGPVIDDLAGLGALSAMTGGRTLEPVTLDTWRGRVVGRTAVSQFGVSYQTMVTGARAALPPGVATAFARVVGCEAVDGHQVLALGDGTHVAARLLVVATGLSTALPRRLGFTYRTIRRDHSVTLGFDIARPAPQAALPPFVQHPHTVRDRIDYMAAFPMGDGLRANLFSYQDSGSAWVRDFCRDPDLALGACMPGLERLLGPHRVASPVQMRSNDLRVVEAPARSGVVVVGDAFQTPCPSAGTGIDRLLSDVLTLARHVPSWLASPGMDEGKISGFYADPAKCAADARALRIAEFRRTLSTERSARWAFRRMQVPLRIWVKSTAGDAASVLRLRGRRR